MIRNDDEKKPSRYVLVLDAADGSAARACNSFASRGAESAGAVDSAAGSPGAGCTVATAALRPKFFVAGVPIGQPSEDAGPSETPTRIARDWCALSSDSDIKRVSNIISTCAARPTRSSNPVTPDPRQVMTPKAQNSNDMLRTFGLLYSLC